MCTLRASAALTLVVCLLAGCAAPEAGVCREGIECAPPGARPAAVSVRVVTWNVKDAMSVDDVLARVADFQGAGQMLRPDVLCIQEITSRAVVEAIRDQMGLSGYHVACSDFVQSDGANRNAFEVAIISRFPFGDVIEYDTSPDNSGDDPAERPLPDVTAYGFKQVNPSRGYLWASIPSLKMTVVVVHLKSSVGAVGGRDASNADKREWVMAAVALGVNADLSALPDYDCLVAGDFNVGHTDPLKNGSDPRGDCLEGAACGAADLYDETHAILRGGLIDGLIMRNLAGGIPDTTFPDYPGSPIDNIYVAGPTQSRFSAAVKAPQTFGSDHLALITECMN